MSKSKLIAIVLSVVCFLPGVAFFTNVNSAGNINRILSARSYSVYINSCGCFGCEKQKLQVIKKPGDTTALLTFYDYPGNKRAEKQKRIAWNSAKEELLGKLFVKSIHDNAWHGCTTQTQYQLLSFPFIVKWETYNCYCNDLVDKVLR